MTTNTIAVSSSSTVNSITVTNSSAISVITAGTQGLAGPNSILGRSVVDSTASTAGSLLVYDHSNTQWIDSQATAAQSLTAKLYNLQFTTGGATVTQILDEDNLGSNSNTALATQQSIKAYVDAELTSQDLDIQGDSGGALSIDLDSETLTIAGGTGLASVGSGNTVTLNIDSTVTTLTGTQTLTNKTLTAPVLNTVDINGGDISSDTTINKSPQITLAGDLSGSVTLTSLGNGTLTATIEANSVALGTDTTGNYVATISAGEGIDVSGSGSETAGVTISAEDATDSNKGIASFDATDFTVSSGDVTVNAERIQDIVGAMVSSNTESGIAVAYQDSDGTLDFDVGDFDIALTGDVTGTGTVTNLGNVSITTTVAANSVALGTDTTGNYVATLAAANSGIDVANSGSETAGVTVGLNTEYVQDIVGAMFSSNTETGIAATYEDSDGTIDLIIGSGVITNAMLAGSIANSNLANSSITVTDGSNSTATALGGTITFSAGEGIDVAESSGTITVSGEDASSSNKGIASFDSTDFSVSSGAVSLQAERIQDIVGAMVSSNTESGIAVSYEDSDGTLDFNVNDPTLTFTGDVTGSGTMTDLGNTSIALTVAANSVALGTDTTGNYVATIAGTSNEIEVSGSGSESATVTIGLPDDVTIGNDLTVTGDLTVNGDTVTLNTSTLTVEDLTIRVGKGATSLANTDGAGIEFGASTSKPTITWDNGNSRLSSNKTFYAATLVGALTGNVTGNADTATALATARTIHGVSFDGTANIDLSEVVQDTVGAMFSSNTETGLSATYQDSDGTIDLVVGSGDITNAMLAGSIANSKLANSTITVSDGSNSTATALGGTITFAAGEGIDVAESSGTVTFSAEDATSSNKGVASFDSTDFSVSSGAVTIQAERVQDLVGAMFSSNTETGISATYEDGDGTIDLVIGSGAITNAMLAGSIANSNLANSAITVTDGSNSTATSLGGTITFTAGEGLDITESSGTLTFAGEDATSSNKGIASFGSDFSVSSGAVALSNSGVSAASYGTSTAIPAITVDAKGRITAISTNSISTSFTLAADSGSNDTFNTGDTLTFAGGEGIDTTVSNNQISIAAEEATSSNKGVASFDSTDFTVSSGAVTVNAERIQDIAGAMFSSNTETGITATYQDSDGTIDLVVGTLNQDTTGTADNFTVTANNSTDETVYPIFVDGATGSQGAESDTGLTYNPSTGTLTSTVLAGTLSTAAQTNVTSLGTLSALTVSGDLLVNTNTFKVDSSNNRVGIKNASPDVGLDAGSVTDAFHVPVGTTAQRPTGAAGYFRYNSTLGRFEGYTDSWGEIGGGGSNTFSVNTYTADGSTDAFTLSQTPSSEDNLFVFVEGVFMNPNDYVLNGTTLTLDAAPPNGRKIVVYSVRAAVSGNNLNHDQFTCNGNSSGNLGTEFTLTIEPVSENNTQVFLDGVYQQKTDYSVSGTTLTMDTAPASGAILEVMTFTQTDINTPVNDSITNDHLNASVISGLTEVTPASGDKMMILDATDSALKKSDVKDIMATAVSITSAADAVAMTFDSSENATFAANIEVNGDITGQDDLYLDSDAAVIHLGEDGDVTLTHVADTGVLLNSARQLQFGDSGTYIHQSADGVLDLVSDTEIEINATTIDVNGNLDVSGTISSAGDITAIGIKAIESVNGDPVLGHFYNANSGNAAESTVYITNSSTVSDGLFLQAYGASATTAGGFVQDAATLGSGTGASGGLSIMTRAAADMRFYTNGHTNERMRIDSNGNVGIGETSPTGTALQIRRSGAAGIVLKETGVAQFYVEQDTDAKIRWTNSNALIFSGGSNGTTEMARIDSSGRVLIGSDTALSVTGGARQFQIEGTTGVTAAMSIIRHSNSAGGATISLSKSRATADGGVTVVAHNDVLGELRFTGADGSDHDAVAAAIKGEVDGTPGSNDMPARLTFWTTSDGSAAETERMRINSSGNVGIGTDDPLNVLDTAFTASAHTSGISITNKQTGGWGSTLAFNSTRSDDSSIKTAARIRTEGAESWNADSTTSSTLIFETRSNNTLAERMRLSQGGNLSIGRTSTSNGATDHGIDAYANGFLYLLVDGSGNTDAVRVYNASGTNVAAIDCDGDYMDLSDERYKENIVDAPSVLDTISKMKVRSFNWKEDGRKKTYGFIAQELNEVVSEAVSPPQDDESVWGVKHAKIVPMLTKAIQEQQTLIEELQAEVKALKEA